MIKSIEIQEDSIHSPTLILEDEGDTVYLTVNCGDIESAEGIRLTDAMELQLIYWLNHRILKRVK